jgi:acetylglutamate kinase
MDADGELIREMSAADARKAIDTGVATGGMIPKLETCIAARADGVEAAVILDGRQPLVLLRELFTEHGAGTLIQ